jgi:hypothetical protein
MPVKVKLPKQVKKKTIEDDYEADLKRADAFVPLEEVSVGPITSIHPFSINSPPPQKLTPHLSPSITMITIL